MARRMSVKDEDLVHIKRGALLHDIGKMGVPDSILLKPCKLTDEEWEIMKQHPVYAYKMFSRIEYLHQALDIPYCHHEKWDGSGCPRRLKGKQIPLAGAHLCRSRCLRCINQRAALPQGLERRRCLELDPGRKRQTLRPGSGGGVSGGNRQAVLTGFLYPLVSL